MMIRTCDIMKLFLASGQYIVSKSGAYKQNNNFKLHLDAVLTRLFSILYKKCLK